MLVVTSGTGWVQERGEEKHVMQVGEVVWCPPDVELWHGATDTTARTLDRVIHGLTKAIRPVCGFQEEAFDSGILLPKNSSAIFISC